MYATSLGVSLNSSNMKAPDRPLAKPAIRIKRFANSLFNVKKIFAYLQPRQSPGDEVSIFGNYHLLD